MTSRALLASLAVLTACGRMGFDAEELAPDAQVSPLPPVVGGPASCAAARPLSPAIDIAAQSLAGARDDIVLPVGCGTGPKLLLRFSAAAREVPIRFESEVDGYYAIGTGCPFSTSTTPLCGELRAEATTETRRLDVTADTYVIISSPTRTSAFVTTLVGLAAL